MKALPPGTTVDRYVLEGVLGEGGMAIVYRARHRDLGSLHAIKQLRVQDPKVRERLVQEGRMQSSLRHPNIVTVTDMITVDDTPALVMEYIDGPSLAELLAQHRPTLAQCDAIARGILKGVVAAHGHGLVHRDLKPGNILIAITDDEVVPKIADFGLAKLLAGQPDPHQMTQEGSAMGTPGYMAPEQINDSSKVDLRADVFSLGAILYELVTGRHCFEGEGVMGVWQAICKGQFTPPESRVPNLPPRMTRAIQGALIVDREQRIAQVSSLLTMWSTDDSGERIPVMQKSGLDLKPLRPATSAHTAPTMDSQVQSELAYEQTRDSAETPPLRPMAPTLGPPVHVPSSPANTGDALEALDTETAERSALKRPSARRFIGLAVLLLVAVAVVASLNVDPPPTPQFVNLTQDIQKTPPPPAANAGIFALDDDASPAAQRQLATARKALLDGEFATAERVLNGLLETAPQTRQAHGLLALNHFFRGRLIISGEASRRAAALARDREDVTSQLIRLADRSWREMDNAKTLLTRWKALREAHADDPMVEVAYLTAGRFLLGPKKGLAGSQDAAKRFPQWVVFTFLELHNLTELGRHQARFDRAQDAFKRLPAVTRLLLEMAQAQIELGDHAAAEVNLKKALAQDPSLTAARTALAGVYMRSNREADRVQQMLIVLSDTTAPIDQVNFLQRHGQDLGFAGHLTEAEKILRFCLDTAAQGTFPAKALGCSHVALDALLWLKPSDQWAPWFEKVETTLARPELDPDLRTFYALRTSWLKATAAARAGEMKTAETIHARTRTMKTWNAVMDAPLFFEREIRWEILWARQDHAQLTALMDEWTARAQKKGKPLSCPHRLRAADLALARRTPDDIEPHLRAIVQGKCAPNGQTPYVRATAHVRLAEYLAQKGESNAAREQLDAFSAAWPKPQADLALVQQAAAVRSRLSAP